MTTKELTRRQARWAEILGSFDFEIRSRPGKQSTKPDALSRRPDLKPKEGDKLTFGRFLKPENLPQDAFIDSLECMDLWIKQEDQIEIDDVNLELNALNVNEEIWSNDQLLKEIREVSRQDKRIQQIMNVCVDMPTSKLIVDYTINEQILYFRDKAVVPDNDNLKLQILKSRHSSKLAGHPGRMPTLMLVKHNFHWPSMKAYINKYVDGCQSCQRVKTRTSKPYGALQPLPVPSGPWVDVCYNMITDLPESEGYDCILTVVDRFTKMAHFIACNKTMNSEQLAQLMIQNVWKIHGTPKTITSDRGNIFISKLTQEMNSSLGIKTQASTAYHPQTDGQSEITNKAVEHFIRHFMSYKQDNWKSLLPLAEFSYNNNLHLSIGMSPFRANYGHDVSFTGTQNEEQKLPAVNELIEQINEIQEKLREAMKISQDEMKRQFDRKVLNAPEWQRGNLVWLNGKHISTTRPSAKFSH